LNWREYITYLEEKFFLLHTSLGFRSGNWRNATRLTAEIKYAIKVKATESHPAKSVTEFHWTTLSRKFKPNNRKIHRKNYGAPN